MKLSHMFFSFKGRLNRQRYWLATIGYSLLMFIFQITLILGIFAREVEPPAFIGPVLLVYGLISLWVMLAVSTKRFHDINKSGWNILWGFIPIVGPILLFVWLGIIKGTAGDNRFGADLLPPQEHSKPVSTQKVVLIVTAIVALSVVIMGIMFYSMLGVIKDNESYRTAESYLLQNAEVSEAVGGIKTFSTFPMGSHVSNKDGSGQAIYAIEVVGNKITKTYMVILSKQPQQAWVVESVDDQEKLGQ